MIPTNFDILEKDESKSEKPILLKQWENCTDLWYKKDDKFGRPKSMISMRLYTNDCSFGQNPKARVFTHVWQKIQEEYLREFNYMATLAQLDFSVALGSDNV